MANLIEKLVKMLRIKFPKVMYVKLLEEDFNKRDRAAGLGAEVSNFVEADGESVPGTGAGAGDIIATYALAAGAVLAIYNIDVGANATCLLRLATGTPAAPVDYLQLRIAAAGDIFRGSDKKPLCVIDNSAGVAAINVIIYAPSVLDAGGANSNNLAATYFSAYFSGELL